MNKNEFIDKTLKLFKIKNFNISFLDWQLEIYKNFLQQQNKYMNLTRLDDEKNIWSNYFFKSIIVYNSINFTNINTLLDVGSGSGIPGVVLKLFFPNVKLTLIDSNRKKCYFLQQLIKKINLNNVEIIWQRIENLSKYRQFDLTTAKALAPVEIVLEMLLPFTKINGLCVVPKSKNFLSEVKNLNQEINQLGGKLICVDYIKFDNHDFYTIIIKKNSNTPKKYPRDYKYMLKGFDYEK